jgi:transposase
MPWKECNQMDERLKFIARLLDGEKMAAVCRDFNVSRKTGYKSLKRYNDVGLEGLTDRSRRPYRHANQLPVQIETLIVRCKQDKPNWGAPKIRERLTLAVRAGRLADHATRRSFRWVFGRRQRGVDLSHLRGGHSHTNFDQAGDTSGLPFSTT